MNIRTQLALLVGLLALVSSATTAFGQAGASGAPSTDGESAYGPSVIRIGDAQVTCIHKIQVSAQVEGLIEQLLVDEGHMVKQGDTLIKIDSRLADAQLSVAQRELEAAEKTAEQTANVDYARAAAALSKEEYEDELRLWDKRSTTYSVLKRKRLEAQRSFFSQDVAEVTHENEILAAEVAREKVKQAQVQLELYKVVAPYDGVIVQRIRDRGEWIRSGDPVLRLFHMDKMMVEALVPVDGISVAALEGAPVKIRVKINPQQFANYEAKIDFVSPEVSSRRVRVTTRIENEKLDNSAWLLRDGMVASLEIQL